MKSVIISLLVLFSLSSSAQKTNKNKSDNRFAGLDTTFNRVLKEWKAAGFAVAVVEKDKVIYAKGFGYKDYETKADGKLYMFVPGQPEYELQYVGDDRFAIKSLSGYHVQFERREQRQIIAAIAQQPNGNFRAKKQ